MTQLQITLWSVIVAGLALAPIFAGPCMLIAYVVGGLLGFLLGKSIYAEVESDVRRKGDG